jgi:hypothetical protein
LDLPLGLVFDSAGNLYVANQHGGSGIGVAVGSIVKFTSSGGILCTNGSVFASSSQQLNNPPLGVPCGLAFDSAGNLYAANIGLANIGKFTQQGVGSLFAKVGPNAPDFIAIEVPKTSAFQIISLAREGNDLRVAWLMAPGATNALQVSSGGTDGSYNTNGFSDIFIVTNNTTAGTLTNYLDIGAATNTPSRYYRARLAP